MEILDCCSIPKSIREPIYLSLALTQRIAGLRKILLVEVFEEVRKLRAKKIIELGCGSGRNTASLAQFGYERGCADIHFVLSDKFPSLNLWQNNLDKLSNLSAIASSFCFEDIVDLKVTEDDEIAFLIISASHHMDDDSFRSFLRKSALLGAHIIIVEPLERKLSHALLALLGSLAGLLTPFIKCLSLKNRLHQILIYYSGLGIFIQSVDGVLSTLKQRSRKQMERLALGLPYTIRHKAGLGPLRNFSITVFHYNRDHDARM